MYVCQSFVLSGDSVLYFAVFSVNICRIIFYGHSLVDWDRSIWREVESIRSSSAEDGSETVVLGLPRTGGQPVQQQQVHQQQVKTSPPVPAQEYEMFRGPSGAWVKMYKKIHMVVQIQTWKFKFLKVWMMYVCMSKFRFIGRLGFIFCCIFG